MAEVPKIVHEQLRAASIDPAARTLPHPESDLLSAFAEQSLSAAERDNILSHLTLCEDCREIVALALPAEDTAMAPSTATEVSVVPISNNISEKSQKIFSWPTMRWTALATACAVVAVVLVVRKVESPDRTSNTPQVASNATPVLVLPKDATPNSPQDGSKVPTVQTEVSTLVSTLKRPTQIAAPMHKSHAALDAFARSTIPADKPSSQPVLRIDGGRDETRMAYSQAAPGSASSLESLKIPTAPTANEQIGVSSEEVAVNTAPSTEKALADGTAPAIVRAKPAPDDAQQNTLTMQKKQNSSGPVHVGGNFTALQTVATNNLVAPNLMIDAAGVLQRSTDDGKTWQTALHAQGRLLCYTAHGADVWTGGQSGLLYHSTDQGTTWEQVKPSSGGNVLTADVIHIGLPRLKPSTGGLSAGLQARQPSSNSAASIMISTANNQVWTSVDGGKTWTTQ